MIEDIFVTNNVTDFENRIVVPFCNNTGFDEWKMKLNKLTDGEIWAAITHVSVHLFSPMYTSHLHPWYHVLGYFATSVSGHVEMLRSNLPFEFRVKESIWDSAELLRNKIKYYQIKKSDLIKKGHIRTILDNSEIRAELEKVMKPFEVTVHMLLDKLEEYDSEEDKRIRREAYIFREETL